MKNAIALMLTFALIIAASVWFESTETKYSIDGTVTRVVVPGEVMVTDARGEDWLVYIDGRTEIGDAVVLYMDTKGTEAIRDDEVVDIRRKGERK